MAFDGPPRPTSVTPDAAPVDSRGAIRSVIGGFGARADAQLEAQVSNNMMASVRDTPWGRLPAFQISTHGYARFDVTHRSRVTGMASTGEPVERLAVAYGNEIVLYEDPSDPTKIATLDGGLSHTGAFARDSYGCAAAGANTFVFAASNGEVKRRASNGAVTTILTREALGFKTPVGIAWAASGYGSSPRMWISFAESYLVEAFDGATWQRTPDYDCDAQLLLVRHPESLFATQNSLLVVDAESASVRIMYYDPSGAPARRWTTGTNICFDLGTRYGDEDPSVRPVALGGVWANASEIRVVDRTSRVVRVFGADTGYPISEIPIPHLRGTSGMPSTTTLAPCGLLESHVYVPGEQYTDDHARLFNYTTGSQAYRWSDPTPQTWPVRETPIISLGDGQWLAWLVRNKVNYVKLDSNELWWNITGRVDRLIPHDKSRFVAIDLAAGLVKLSPQGLRERSIFTQYGITAGATPFIERLPRGAAEANQRWRMQVWFSTSHAYSMEHEGTEFIVFPTPTTRRRVFLPKDGLFDRGLYRYDRVDYDPVVTSSRESDAPAPTKITVDGQVILGMCIAGNDTILLTQAANTAASNVSIRTYTGRVPESSADFATADNVVTGAWNPRRQIVSALSASDEWLFLSSAKHQLSEDELEWAEALGLPEGFTAPTDVAAAPNGDFLVSDQTADKIGVYDASQDEWREIDLPSGFTNPLSLDVTPSGDYIVYDSTSGNVGTYDVSTDTWTQLTGLPGTRSLTALSDGRYICCTATHIYRTQDTGNTAWTQLSPPGGWGNLTGVAAGPRGIVIVDTTKDSLAVSGDSAASWTPIAFPSGLGNVRDVDVLPNGNYVVVDDATNDVAIYDVTTQTWSRKDLPARFTSPRGVAVTDGGNLVVVDRAARAIGLSHSRSGNLLPALTALRRSDGSTVDLASLTVDTFDAWTGDIPRPAPAVWIDGLLYLTETKLEGDELHTYSYDPESPEVHAWVRDENSGRELTGTPSVIRSISTDCAYIYVQSGEVGLRPTRESSALLPNDTFVAYWLINPDTRQVEWSPTAASKTNPSGIGKLRTLVYAPGSTETNIYQLVDPQADFPFSVTDSAEVGIAAIESMLEVSGRLLFVGRTYFGGLGVYQFGGQGDTTPERISNKSVDAVLEAITEIAAQPEYGASVDPLAGCVAYAEAYEGHVIYCLNFRWPGLCLCYDLDTGLWHTRSSTRIATDSAAEVVARAADDSLLVEFGVPGLGTMQGGTQVRHTAQWRTRLMCGGYGMVGGQQRGILAWADSRDYHDLDGSPVERAKTFDLPIAGAGKGYFGRLRCDLAAGAVESGVKGWVGNPVVHLDESNDGGRSFRLRESRTLGVIGSSKPVRPFNRLGGSFNRVFKLRCDEAPLTILGAYVSKRRDRKM